MFGALVQESCPCGRPLWNPSHTAEAKLIAPVNEGYGMPWEDKGLIAQDAT